MKFKESTLKIFAAPLSETENAKCKHAIEEIRDALKDLGYTDDQKGLSLLESETLAYSVSMRKEYSPEKIQIFIQGSYANNTCVRNESDVDIAVVRDDAYEYAFGERFSSSSIDKKEEAVQLKNAVERILRYHFPYQVQRGNKSIKVDGNTYRKQADTVPCFSMRYYYRSHLENYSSYHEGVVIFADDGSIIRNFPKQHIANGKTKNNRTNYYYKKMVRIMKKMRYLMSDQGYTCADRVSSFGVESLLWNIPDSYFTRYSCYGFAFEEIVNYAYRHKTELGNYYEANGIKELCPTQQDIDNYKTFIDTLYSFFEYDYYS
jgi:hypothetical protein